MPAPVKLLIDTDPGQDIDDLLAILFALRRPELDVKAITTVTWPAAGRARLVKRLLRYLGREDIPVAAGMAYPLRPFAAAERQWQSAPRNTMNHGCFAEPEDPRDAAGPEDAVDLIVRTVEQHPGELVLACIAPLTNIATALCRRPEIAAGIKAIYLMGGEVNLPRGEHNIAWDYTAADIVLNSGIPISMGTWDVTRRFVLLPPDCALLAQHPAPVNQALAQAIATWNPAHPWKPGPVMYDLFPMVWAFDRSLYTVKTMPIRIETRGEFTRGWTLAQDGGRQVEVTTDIKTAEVRDLYLQTILA